MTDKELEKSLNDMCQQVVGQQQVIDKLLASPLKRARETANIVLTGERGKGKTEIFKAIAGEMPEDDQTLANVPPAVMASVPKAFTDRFKKIVLMRPMPEETIKQLAEKLIESNGGVPAGRKEEANSIVQELLDQGVIDHEKGLRELKSLIKAITEVSSAPDMREALASRYPVFSQRASMRSGERLAESFTTGTAARTGVRKPVRLKSRGVGFFSLN